VAKATHSEVQLRLADVRTTNQERAGYLRIFAFFSFCLILIDYRTYSLMYVR
jgi:hypothetical protein